MDWAVALGVAGGMLAGLGVAVLVRTSGRARDGGDGRTAITTEAKDPRGGLARKSLDSLRVGVVVLDGDDHPVLVNPSARAMGLLRAGAAPGTIAAHPVVRTLAAQVRRGGVRREAELDLPRGGEAGAAEPLGVLLRAVGLGGDYVAVEAADVTESHRVDRVRRDFVANVGHELKTPIGALQLLAEALLDATEPVPTNEPAADPAQDVAAARRFAERIHHESNRLGRLVTELLELSRVQGAEPLPERTPVAVDWLVAEVLDRARTGATAKQIEISVAGQPGLTVYGSGNQLATALTNLVGNAVAYSPEHSQVVISSRAVDDHVEIAVTDHGIGIAPKELDRIFERFYRSDRARSRATGGTGLGLAIVKHIATNHGGRVDVSSMLGEGSTFTLRLPARPPDAPMAIPHPDEIDAGRAPARPPGAGPGAAPVQTTSRAAG
jgi:two-component system sensor histidine kinase SenX3